MTEISLHILDIVQNSVDAGARRIEISVSEDGKSDLLSVNVSDNGSGMSDEFAAKAAASPFVTTKTDRRTGLGLPLLKSAAESCGGGLKIASRKGFGTELSVWFKRSHIDRPPMGDLAATLTTAVTGNPDIDFLYAHNVNGRSFAASSAVLRGALDGLPLNAPMLFRGIEEYFRNNISRLYN